MPEISRFFGIVVTMYMNDHAPPHFHVRYADQRAVVDIATEAIVRGWLAPGVRRLVVTWARPHRQELFANWRLVSVGHDPRAINPLE